MSHAEVNKNIAKNGRHECAAKENHQNKYKQKNVMTSLNQNFQKREKSITIGSMIWLQNAVTNTHTNINTNAHTHTHTHTYTHTRTHTQASSSMLTYSVMK